MITSLNRFDKARMNGVSYPVLSGVDEYGFRVQNDDGTPLNPIEKDLVTLCRILIFQGISMTRLAEELPDFLPDGRPLQTILRRYACSSKKRLRHVPNNIRLKSYLDLGLIIQYALPFEMMLVNEECFNVWKLIHQERDT